MSKVYPYGIISQLQCAFTQITELEDYLYTQIQVYTKYALRKIQDVGTKLVCCWPTVHNAGQKLNIGSTIEIWEKMELENTLLSFPDHKDRSAKSTGNDLMQDSWTFQAWIYQCHLHPLQAANCCRNSRLVVDIDDLKWVKTLWKLQCIGKPVSWKFSFQNP